MPIRPQNRPMYPPEWPAISVQIRFERANGRCEQCGRPHAQRVKGLPDGRWFDEAANHWRDGAGRPAAHPDIVEFCDVRVWRVVLAACHRDHDPRNCAPDNLASWCQRCHLLHDKEWHRYQRRLTVLERRALGDLFEGQYGVLRWHPRSVAMLRPPGGPWSPAGPGFGPADRS